MDKLMCRCGKEMKPRYDSDPMEYGDFYSHFACECGWIAPWGKVKHTKEEAAQSAYEAAVRCAPNVPLTKEQILDMDGYDALWRVRIHDGHLCEIVFAKHLQDIYEKYTEEISQGVMRGDFMLGEHLMANAYFASKPTTADIETAMEERNK
jgi:hypothetical protein